MKITCLSLVPPQVTQAIADRLGVDRNLIESTKQHGNNFDLVGLVLILNSQNPKTFDKFTFEDWDDFVDEHIDEIMRVLDFSRKFNARSIDFNLKNQGYSINDYLTFVNDNRELLNKTINVTDENRELIQDIIGNPMFKLFGNRLEKGFFNKDGVVYLSFPDLRKEVELRYRNSFKILQSAKSLNLPEEKKAEIYENYVKLMDRKREGKAITRDKFDFMFDNLQVYQNGDTYIFGEWDTKNNLFRGRLMSSPNIRQLYESLDILFGNVPFMASVPEDIGKMLRKKGLYELKVDKPYNFRGEDMIKHLYFSDEDLARKVFRKNISEITYEDVEGYDRFYNQYKLIQQLKALFFSGDYQGLVRTLIDLGIYDRNAYNYVKKLRNGELTEKEKHDIIQHIISNTKSNKVNIESEDEINTDSVYEKLNTEVNKILVKYLSKFGFKTEITQDLEKLGIDGYSTILILNKIAYINENKQENFPEEAGTVIAFMMQHNPLVTEIMKDMEVYSMFKKGISKEEKLQAVGDLIADELHKRTNEQAPKSLKDKIKNLIRQFLDFLHNIRLSRVNRNIGYIVDNIIIQNEALITQSMYKPGAVGEPLTRVTLEKALKSDKFGSDVIEKLADYFILTGSVSAAEQGTIYRPEENLLHDIDWASPYSSEENKRIFEKVFPDSKYIRQISDEGKVSVTDTWLIVPEGYTIDNLELEGDNNVIAYYDIVDKDGNVVNSYSNRKNSDGVRVEKFTNNTVFGKTIDVFSDNGRESFMSKTLSGKPLRLSSWLDTFRAKLEYSRLKDIWDYNRFIPNDNLQEDIVFENEEEESVVDDNIYHNRTLTEIYLGLLNYARQVTTGNDSKVSLKRFNELYGTDFQYRDNKRGDVRFGSGKLQGVSIYNANDTQVQAKTRIDRVVLLDYLTSKFGLKTKVLDDSQYNKKFGQFSNCSVVGDTVYLKDKKVYEPEQVIEEFLHPCVHAIYDNNKELAQKLLDEARKNFPDLAKLIGIMYGDQEQNVQDEELITHVLSKYLNKEISDNGTNTRNLVDYIHQFFDKILEFFKDLFGDVRVSKDDRITISGKDIKDALSYENLAELINSKQIRFNDRLIGNDYRNNRGREAFEKLGAIYIIPGLNYLTRPNIKSKEKEVFKDYDKITHRSNTQILLARFFDAYGSDVYIQSDLPANASENLQRQLKEIKKHNEEATSASSAITAPRNESDEELNKFARIYKDQLERIAKFRHDIILEYYGIDVEYEKLKYFSDEYGNYTEKIFDANSISSISETQEKLKSLENSFRKNVIDAFNKRVVKPKDFLKSHIYYRVVDEQDNVFDHEDKENGVVKFEDENGNTRYGVKIETSASKIIEKPGRKKVDDVPGKIRTTLGTDFDSIVRQYLKDGTIPVWTNFNKSIINDIKSYLEGFKKQLNDKFGEGKYIVITDEFPMAIKGYKLDKKGRPVSEYIAGTTDMIVITDDGKVHIFDMKTTGNSEGLSDEAKTGYYALLNAYKEMISSALRGTDMQVSETGIMLVHLHYPNNYGDYIVEEKDGRTTLKVKKSRNNPEYQNLSDVSSERFYFVQMQSSIGDYITHLDNIESKDKAKVYYYFESLIKEENISEEEAEELTQSFGFESDAEDDSATETIGPAENFEDEYQGFVEENQYTPQDYRSVTHKEVIDIGRSTVKFVTWIAKKMSVDKDGSFISQWIDDEKYSLHEEGKTPMLYGMSVSDILKTDDLFMQLFKNVIDTFQYNDEDIPGTSDFDRKQWIKDNWRYIMNNSFAELNDINGIRLEPHINKIQIIDVDPNDFELIYDIASGELEQEETAYDVNKRTINLEEIQPKQIKQRLATMLIYRYDENGDMVLDENGDGDPEIDENNMPKFFDKHYVSQVLYDNICGMKTRQDMIAKLEKLSEDPRYRWIRQILLLIDRRQASTYDNDFAKVFFKTFRKSKNNYEEIYDNEENSAYQKQTLKPLGLKERSKKMVQKTNEFFQNGGYTSLLSKKDNGQFNDSIEVDMGQLGNTGLFYKLLDSFENNKTTSVFAQELISMLGIQVDDLSSITDSMLSKPKGKNRTLGSELYNKLNKIYTILSNSDGEIRLSDINLQKAIGLIADLIDFAMNDTGDISIRSGDKSYQTYSEPSFILDTIDDLNGLSEIESNQDELPVVLRDPTSKYNRFRQFRRLVNGRPVYINSFLRRIMEDPSKKAYLMHITHTITNGKQYKELGDKDYFMSLIKGFFAPMETGNLFGYDPSEKVARFRVLMLSDKNSLEFVQFQAEGDAMTGVSDSRYENEFYKQFSKPAYEYFMYELERMKSVLHLLRYGPKDGSLDIDNFNIKRKDAPAFLTDKIEKIIHERDSQGNLQSKKVIRYRKITRSDILNDDGSFKNWFIKSGISFRYLSYLNEEIKNGTEFGNAVLDLINDEALSDERDGRKTITPSEQYEKARNIVANQFNGLHKKYMEQYFNEFITLTKTMFSAEELKGISQVFKDINPYGKEGMRLLRWMYYNDNLAAMNIANMTVIDPAFNKDTIDFQKRFAQVHSQTLRCDKENTFNLNGTPKRYSDGKFRFAVIDDLIMSSELKPVVRQVFLDLYKKTNNIQYKILAETIPDMFDTKTGDGVNVTDGLAYNSPTSLWKKLGMLGQDNPEFNKAYQQIRKGDFSIGNINIVLQTLKPFVYGFSEQFDNTNIASDEGTKLVPVQLKDSESLIILAGAIMEGAKVDSPLRAVFEIMEESAFGRKKDHSLNNYTGQGIDSIVFKSAVKVGGSGVLHIAGKSYAEAKKELQKVFKGSSSDYDSAYVHEMDFDAFGIQLNVPPHMQEHEQPLGSQERILALTDILDPDFKVTVNGEEYTKDKLIAEYGKMMKEDYGAGIFLLMRDFGAKKIGGKYVINRNKFNLHLSKLLTTKVVGDTKYSNELYRAFSTLFNTNPNPKDKDKNNYEFVVPIGDPTLANVVYSVLFSEIKHHINEQNIQGGPAVQMSVFGSSNELYVTDSNGNKLDMKRAQKDAKYLLEFYKSGLLFEAYVTAPTEEFERAITKDDGSIMNMDEILEEVKKGNISQDDFDNATKFIAYRIPTEDKYSIFRCKVKGFIPRQQGELVVLPKDITLLSGTDFDVDKLYCWFRKTWKQVYDMQDEQDRTRYKKRNSIFDMQWETLGHESSVEKQLYPGGYELLKELAIDINPDYKSGGQNIFFMQTLLALRKLNQAGKNFVGIAALNNVCHGMASFCNIKLSELPRFTMQFEVKKETKNSKITKSTVTVSSYRSEKGITKITDENGEFTFDSISSVFDGSRISRTLSMFVGASADNAKEALLGVLNITPTTANYATTMIRMGIPIQMVVYMMNNPKIKELSQIADNSGERFENVILTEYMNNPYIGDYTISQKELLDRINQYKGVSDISAQLQKDGNKDIDMAVLKLFFDMTKICMDVSNMNSYLSLNSMKNNVGPTITDLFRKRMQIQKFMKDVNDETSSFNENTLELIDKGLPYMLNLWKCYTTVIDDMCKSFSPVFNREFIDMLQTLYEQGFRIDQKNINNLINGYLLFKAKTLGIFGKGEGTIGGIRKEGESDLQYSENSRRRLLYTFVDRFQQVRENYEWNDFIRSLRVEPMNSRNPVMAVKFNNAGSSRETIEDMAASWETLNDSGDKPRGLSTTMFEYMVTRFGFQWMPDSAGSIAPMGVKSSIKGYKDIFNPDINLFGYNTANLQFERFVDLFARNNPKCGLWKLTTISYDDNGDPILYAENYVDGQYGYASKFYKQLYRISDRTVYEDSEGKSYFKLKEVYKLGIANNFMEYDPDIEDLETIVGVLQEQSEETEQNDETTPEQYQSESLTDDSDLFSNYGGYVGQLTGIYNENIPINSNIGYKISKDLLSKYQDISTKKSSQKKHIEYTISLIRGTQELEKDIKSKLISELEDIKKKIC